MVWLKVQEYVKKHNVTPMSVYGKIKRKTIPFKKVKGVTYVQDLQDQDIQQQQIEQQKQNQELSKLQNQERKVKLELQLEKLKNLREDTLIKKQKQTYTKELYRQEYVDGVFDCFTESFSNIKNLIIELKLKKEDNAKFKKIFSQCIKKFQISLKRYLAEADKKELEQQESEIKNNEAE